MIHPSNDPPLRCKYIPLRTNRPISSTEPRTSSTEPLHFLHRATHILHEPPHFLHRTALFIYETTQSSPASDPFLRRSHHTLTHIAPTTRIHHPKYTHFCALSYQGGGAVVRWERSGSPIQTDRCSHAVRAFVRRHRKKVYKVSEESL